MIQQWPQVGSVVEKCCLPGGLGFLPGSLGHPVTQVGDGGSRHRDVPAFIQTAVGGRAVL